jgi:phosphopantothenoylcysteine decarboxylase/phosphopantothenate--cysteine ligase
MKPLRILITAGPTREPIDPVRYIGNRSSGRMGAALAEASIAAGYETTLIVGPGVVPMPANLHRIDIETAAQMEAAVMEQFPSHDLLIMAAAVADFRPKSISEIKLARENSLSIECEPTADIVAAAARLKQSHQRLIGFSLETTDDLTRAKEKLVRKGLDLIVFNLAETMNSPLIAAVLIHPGGRTEFRPVTSKPDFAAYLLSRIGSLFE